MRQPFKNGKGGGLIDDLIANETKMSTTEENFGIARKFINRQLTNHSFPDTNEHLVKKTWKDLEMKLRLHSQDDRADRLQYLYSEFYKRKTFANNGIGETHAAVLSFLIAMSVNPTGRAEDALLETEDKDHQRQFLLQGKVQSFGIGGICDDLPSNKIYASKEEFNQAKLEA